jgi:hypothetical protein
MTLDRRSRQLRHSAATLALVTALLTVVPAVAGRAGARERRVVVTFAAGTGAQARSGAIAAGGAVLDVVDVPSGTGPRRRTSTVTGRSLAVMKVTPAERAALRDDPRVASVEDDVPVRADAVASDPGYTLAEGLRLVGVEAALRL